MNPDDGEGKSEDEESDRSREQGSFKSDNPVAESDPRLSGLSLLNESDRETGIERGDLGRVVDIAGPCEVCMSSTNSAVFTEKHLIQPLSCYNRDLLSCLYERCSFRGSDGLKRVFFDRAVKPF